MDSSYSNNTDRCNNTYIQNLHLVNFLVKFVWISQYKKTASEVFKTEQVNDEQKVIVIIMKFERMIQK